MLLWIRLKQINDLFQYLFNHFLIHLIIFIRNNKKWCDLNFQLWLYFVFQDGYCDVEKKVVDKSAMNLAVFRQKPPMRRQSFSTAAAQRRPAFTTNVWRPGVWRALSNESCPAADAIAWDELCWEWSVYTMIREWGECENTISRALDESPSSTAFFSFSFFLYFFSFSDKSVVGISGSTGGSIGRKNLEEHGVNLLFERTATDDPNNSSLLRRSLF